MIRALAGFAGVLCLVTVAGARGPYGGTVRDLVPDGRKDGPAWAATERGLFRYRGGQWRRFQGLGQTNLSAVIVTRDRILVARADGRVLASDDLGTTWAESDDGLVGRFGHRSRRILSLVIDPASIGRVYAGTAGQGVFVSVDQGRTWRRMGNGLDDEPPAAHHVSAVLPGADERPLLVGTDGRGLFRWIRDRWQPVAGGLPEGVRVQTLVADPSDSEHLALGTRGDGLWESHDDGQTWKRLRKGAFGVVDAVAVAPRGAVLAHFPEEGLVLARGGKASRPAELKRTRVNRLVALAGGRWLAGLQHDGVMALTAEGVPSGDINRGLDATRILSLAVGDEAGILWCGDTNGVFRFDPAGGRWAPEEEGLLGAPANGFLRQGGVLYLGTGGQGVFAWNPEKGRWEPRSRGLGTSNTIYSLAGDGQSLYVGTEGGVFASSDGGRTWTPRKRGLPLAGMWRLGAGSAVPGVVWASGGGGIFHSIDGGESWKRVADAEARVLVEDGGWWIVEDHRILRTRGDTLESVAALEGLERFTALLPDGSSAWVGATDGLWRVGPAGVEKIWSGPGISSLVRDDAGRLVAGTDGAGVLFFRLER